MDFEPPALDTCEPSKEIRPKWPTSKTARVKMAHFTETAHLIVNQNGPLSNHCIYRPNYRDVEICMSNFGTR